MRSFALPDSHKFACLVTHVWPTEGLDSSIDSGNGLQFHAAMPFRLNKSWRESLGTIGLGMLEDVNFCLTISRLSTSPRTLDGENKELFRRVQLAFECMLLSGIPETRAVSVMAGAWLHGHADVRSYGTGQRYYHSLYSQRAPATKESVQTGGVAFRTIESIYADEPSFTRLKNGFFALTKVMKEEDAPFRFHQCVRSIEAITKTDNAKDFAKRSRKLSELLGKQVSKEDLREAYAMRSCTEHLNPITAPFTTQGLPKAKRLKRAGERAGMIEELALACYRAVLTVPGLAGHFKDDGTIKSFWNKSYDQKKQLWSGEISGTQ